MLAWRASEKEHDVNTNISRLMLVLCALMLASATVEAKETLIERGDSGLLSAMGRVGCKAEWLSVVMRESNILEAELGKLRVGRSVLAPDMCDTELPAAADIQVTRDILRNQESLRQARKTENENAALKENVTRIAIEREQAQQEAERLKNERKTGGGNQGMIGTNGGKKNPPQDPPIAGGKTSKSYSKKTVLAAAGGGSALSIAICGFAFWMWWCRLQDRFKLVPYVQKVPWSTIGSPNGHRYFDFSRVMFRCSDHPGEDIDEKNIENHLRRCHYDSPKEENPITRKERQLLMITRRLGRAGISS
jgi:hypothetical protein